MLSEENCMTVLNNRFCIKVNLPQDFVETGRIALD